MNYVVKSTGVVHWEHVSQYQNQSDVSSRNYTVVVLDLSDEVLWK